MSCRYGFNSAMGVCPVRFESGLSVVSLYMVFGKARVEIRARCWI